MNGGFWKPALVWGAKAGPENESTSQALAQQWLPVVCPLKWTWKKQSVEMNGDRNHDKNHDKKRQELGTCGSSARTMHVCVRVCVHKDAARPLVSCIEQDPHSKIHGMGSEFGYQNPHVCLVPCRIRSFHPLLSFFKNWPNADPSCG